MSESLLILAPGRRAAEAEALATVRQRYGERVLVVEGGASERLTGLGTLVPSGSAAAEPGAEFSETERLGILAWNARREMATKSRRGEGLPWDAEGFEPP